MLGIVHCTVQLELLCKTYSTQWFAASFFLRFFSLLRIISSRCLNPAIIPVCRRATIL
jgi:hypothetical protein